VQTVSQEWGSTVSASARQSFDESSRKGGEVLRNLGEWGRGVRDSVLGMSHLLCPSTPRIPSVRLGVTQ